MNQEELLKKLAESVVEMEEEDAVAYSKEYLEAGYDPVEGIGKGLAAGMDQAGRLYEEEEYYIPELLLCSDAMYAGMEVFRPYLLKNRSENNSYKAVIGVVEGDIHDIGKNIVKVLLENYGFDVIDLGKDVPPEAIVEKAVEENVTLVGLSALMTTTVVSMEETIKLLREKKPDCKVMVGGAVLNQDYADMIGADFYGKDAMQSVYYAQRVLKKEKNRETEEK